MYRFAIMYRKKRYIPKMANLDFFFKSELLYPVDRKWLSISVLRIFFANISPRE